MGKPLIGWAIKCLTDRARFSAPWVAGAYKVARYTPVLALEVAGAQIGDVVVADVSLEVSVKPFIDVRFPASQKVQGAAFVPIFFRVGTQAPAVPFLDQDPAIKDVFGSLVDGRGWIMVNDSGVDINPNFVVLDTGKRIIQGGSPYATLHRRMSFIVWRTPVFLVASVAPRSAGANGDSYIEIPNQSNYSRLGYELYQQ